MLFYTHLLFSVLIGLYLLPYSNFNKLIFIALIAFFSFFLDIDKANSKIGKKLGIISILINFIFGHRKLIHSLLFILAGYLILSLFSNLLAISFLIGTLTHLILDSLTKEGVRLLYPLKFHVKGFIKTGSIIETILTIIFLLLIIIKI